MSSLLGSNNSKGLLGFSGNKLVDKGKVSSLFFENKLLFVLVIIGLIVCLVKFLPVSDGRFFSIGDDPSRHLTVINSFIANGGIVFPQDQSGGYSAYVYYAPLFHASVAALSFVLGINPILIQNIVPLFCLIAFYFIMYNILKIFFKDRLRSLFVSTVALFFFPISAPNPHYLVYFILIPAAIFFILKIFNEKKLKHFLGYFAIIFLMGLTHAQSIEFYYVSITLALILGLFIFKELKNIDALILVWLCSSFAYVAAFFFFSFITPTFWEAILHYFSLALTSKDIVNSVYGVYSFLGFNKFVVLGVMAALPALISVVLFFFAPALIKFKSSFVLLIRNLFARVSLPKKAKLIKYFPLAVIFLVLVYLLIWSIIFNVIQFVSTFLFSPAIPYFAQLKAMSGLYFVYFFGRSGFEGLVYPYSIGVILLLIIAAYSIYCLARDGEFANSPHEIILLSFMLPFFFTLFIFPFFNLSSYLNPLILDRLYFYTFPSLVVFCAPVLIKLMDFNFRGAKKNFKRIAIYFGLFVVLVCSSAGGFLSQSFDVNPIQNAGYVWLTSNTPISPNEPELNFDVRGYYHVSEFAKHYSLGFFGSDLISIDLNKVGQTYRPKIDLFLLGGSSSISPQIYWNEILVKEYDDKIYDNPAISFYHEGN